MKLSRVSILALSVLALPGCGTVYNLNDPPDGANFMGTGTCYPFGGVARSSLLAVGGPPVGLATAASGGAAIFQGDFEHGFEHVGEGLGLTAAGIGAIVDIPLSFLGDIVTYPIADARSKMQPWATQWGKKSRGDPKTTPDSPADASDQKSEDTNNPPQ
jgi:uncharacterized protein YceK